ncbi:hypothetical protein FVR03_02520 [Pontibacter qinzhouensis]|uniref:YdeI/OmpD-associated family protein n=1 Tax=Pontibacter qinzhouensis TaxID=2603253 RepID=A0A5C8KD62_9BACT|nr:YdeI/OmpD-associated family protein [Pontibacter qinzhouensis]TXK51975.1 hypothetical protein FVR03_02520 [Pontibacter qinzhouensis]
MQELGKKLQLKKTQQVLLFHAPAPFFKALSEQGFATTAYAAEPAQQADAVQLFVRSQAELETWLPPALAALKPEGLLWIAYPKKSSGTKTDLTRDEGWRLLATFGYEAVRQVALDEAWSSVRFRHSSERKTPSKFGAVYEGIDKETRTVTPPHDLQEALEAANLRSSFEQLAFTHKKEMIVSLLEAKRPETRLKRVQKAIELVRKLAKRA